MSDISKNQEIAMAFCTEEGRDESLVFVEEIQQFALYNDGGGVYELLSRDKLQRMIFEFMHSVMHKNITISMVRDIEKLIEWLVIRRLPNIMTNYLVFNDGVLDLTTFEKEKHSKDRVSFFKVNCALSDVFGDVRASRWEQFLDEVLVGRGGEPDKDLQRCFQEMMGYYLLNTNEAQVMFFLIGAGQNGKSVIIEVLKEIIGKDFYTSVTIEELSKDKHATMMLIGKKLNVVGDDESKFVKSDMFKKIISGDDIRFRPMYKEGFAAQVKTKFLFSTNEPPTFSSLNDGLTRRINIIPFKKKIPDDQKDTKLVNKLISELPGIVRYMIEGAKMLQEKRFRFSVSESMVDAKEEFEKNISSAVLFFCEEYEEWEGSATGWMDMYSHYRAWCIEHGKNAMSSTKFKHDISRKLTLDGTRIYDHDKGRNIRARQVRKKVNHDDEA